MDTDRFFDSQFRNDETLLKRRPWYFLAGALFLVSAFTHVPVVFLAGLFVLVIGLVPELWYRCALNHLTIHQQTNQHMLFFGEHVTLSLRVENRKILPLPWLEVENEIPSFAYSAERYGYAHIDDPQRARIATWIPHCYLYISPEKHGDRHRLIGDMSSSPHVIVLLS